MNAHLEARSEAKWGEAALGGFQIVPDILLKKQVELDLNPTEMLVLINITMHWWYVQERPFPRTTTIAKRMGTDQRTVQRAIKRFQDQGLIERVKEKLENGQERIVCDPSGLVEKLCKLVVDDPDYIGRQQRRLAQGIQGAAIESTL